MIDAQGGVGICVGLIFCSVEVIDFSIEGSLEWWSLLDALYHYQPVVKTTLNSIKTQVFFKSRSNNEQNSQIRLNDRGALSHTPRRVGFVSDVFDETWRSTPVS